MNSKILRRPLGRLFYGLLLLGCSAVLPAYAEGPAMTIVSDVVYRANGQPAGGTIVVSWPALNSADDKPVAAGELSIVIGAQGTVNFSLVPNEGAEPGGTYYKAVYKLADGTSYTEYWVVPAASPTTIAAIRATVVPRQVGAQYVNRQYVDSAVATTQSQMVHKAGNEVIAGTKTFAVSPEVPTPSGGGAAVNRDYVLDSISAISGGFVDRNGDSMDGPLLLPGDPVAPLQAANRHYVDLQVADMNSALANKVNRLNDTPITFGGVKYSSQFASPGAPVTSQVDAACANFGSTPGTVVVPSPGDGSVLRSQVPDHCNLYDQRRSSAPDTFGSETAAILKGEVHRFRWTAPNSDVANGSPSINQTFQGIQVFVDSAKGGINTGTFGATTKSNYRAGNFSINASTPGQHTALEGQCVKFSAGDCLGVAGFAQSWGGSRAGFGDEGSIPVTARMVQGNTIFTGTVSGKVGSTLSLSSTLNANTLGAGTRWLINKTSGVCSATDAATPCNGTTARFTVGSMTVTGVGTTWTSLGTASDYCFSLDAEEVSGKKYLIPVTAWTDDTHLVLMTAPSAFASTTAGAYKLFKCSEVAEVNVDKTSTTPATAPTATLVSAANFNVNDQVELPLSHLWTGIGISAVISPQIATSGATTGIGVSNMNGNASARIANAFVGGGNFRRQIEFNGNSVAADYGYLFANNSPTPAVLLADFDSSGLASIVHTLIARRAATGGEARFTYHNSSDQWSLGNNSSPFLCVKTTGPYVGIGTGCVTAAGTALRVVPDTSDNGININGNTTGYLLSAQVSGVNRFFVNTSQAYFNNGLDVKGYSDNLTTQKWQVTGASGKANFNGGVCQDTAQTVCDLSGTGAPTGACITGSSYRRTDGGTATTLYVCESSAWVASGGGGAPAWSGIGNPGGAQSLAMAANTSTWTWNAATGSNDLLRLTDTASNTGTGHIASIETASSSNAKPFQVKARGTAALEINESGVVSVLNNVTTSLGLIMQIGGAFVIKGRDDWSAPMTISGSDFSGTTSTASSTTVRGGDITATSGANTAGGVLLRSGGSASASGTPGLLQVAQTYAKDTTVTSGLLQCFKAAAVLTVGDCGNSATNSVGVALSASNTNPVIVQFQGIATLVFDGTFSPSAGWFACSSATQGGKVIVQSAACAAGRQVGIVAQNGSSITSGKVFLQAR